KDKQRSLREDTSWYERASEQGAARRARILSFFKLPARTAGSVPIYDLRVAAGQFSASHEPEAIGYVRLDGIAFQPRFFVAKVVGDSMNELAPDGAWCLWELLVGTEAAPAVSGDLVVVRRPDREDADLGEFTFKQLHESAGRIELVPRSSNPAHTRIALERGAEVIAVARFVSILTPSDT